MRRPGAGFNRPAGTPDAAGAGSSAELLGVLARALVAEPERVRVTQERRQDHVVLLLDVAPADVGRVIGRQGRIIRAIRKVIRTTGGPRGKNVVVEVVSK